MLEGGLPSILANRTGFSKEPKFAIPSLPRAVPPLFTLRHTRRNFYCSVLGCFCFFFLCFCFVIFKLFFPRGWLLIMPLPLKDPFRGSRHMALGLPWNNSVSPRSGLHVPALPLPCPRRWLSTLRSEALEASRQTPLLAGLRPKSGRERGQEMAAPTLQLRQAPSWALGSPGSLQPWKAQGGGGRGRPETRRLLGKPGLLRQAREVAWGKRWQEWDSRGQTLFHRSERKRKK